jgi:formate hydrogenlyase subunit 4
MREVAVAVKQKIDLTAFGFRISWAAKLFFESVVPRLRIFQSIKIYNLRILVFLFFDVHLQD